MYFYGNLEIVIDEDKLSLKRRKTIKT